jgi:SanA protein
MRVKRIAAAALILFFVIALVTTLCNYIVAEKSKPYLFDSKNEIPRVTVGLLLGTSKTLGKGIPNAYFFNRIAAAHELYKEGIIRKIIVSGDNGRKEYDEPTDMKMELVKLGIDSNDIILDYAGFRTYDSVIRLKEIFGQTKAIIISQKFHNERAVYIGQRNGMLLYGYNAKDVSAYYGFRTKVREWFARDKVMLDLALGVKPKFLGEKIKLTHEIW